MKLQLFAAILAAGTVVVLALTPAEAASPVPTHSLTLQLKGTATGVMREIDTTGDGIYDTTANCFDIGLYDPRTGLQIGTATDCLSDVSVPIDDNPGSPPLGWNIALTGTTFFNLPGGSLVTQGLTTVRPVLQPTSRDGVVFTHVTGANGDGGVQYGTGRFKHSGGDARLSGMVSLSNLVTGGEITFDCLFVIDLEN